MTHIDFSMVNFVGALVGTLGVIIAIYLQMITHKYCPPKYVIIFLISGVSMIMLNSNTIISNHNEIMILQFIAYIILALLEIFGAYYIWKRLDLDNPLHEVEEELFPD